MVSAVGVVRRETSKIFFKYSSACVHFLKSFGSVLAAHQAYTFSTSTLTIILMIIRLNFGIQSCRPVHGNLFAMCRMTHTHTHTHTGLLKHENSNGLHSQTDTGVAYLKIINIFNEKMRNVRPDYWRENICIAACVTVCVRLPVWVVGSDEPAQTKGWAATKFKIN